MIVCGGAFNGGVTAQVGKIIAAVPCTQKIYVYAPNGDVMTNLFGKDRIVCFGTAKESASVDEILNSRTMKAARAQHEYYRNLYGRDSWEELDSFKRYSNVSSSDFMFTVKRLMEQGVSFDFLAELEHIRWCRYHYLNNWRYGKERDNALRIHHDLVPFSQLTTEEIQKDIEAIKIKLEIEETDS